MASETAGLIRTKYATGDIVWGVDVDSKMETLPCPDRKGSRKWKAISPAGGEHEFSCPRCTRSYMDNSDLRLTYTVRTPVVRKLTVGSVEYRSVGFNGGEPETRYMRRETGIGSGRVYSDDDLFPTEEAARARADVLAKVADTNAIKTDTYWHGRLEVSDYQLADARFEAVKRDLRELRDDVRWLVRDVREAIAHSHDLKADIAEAFSERLKVDVLEAP